MIRFSAGHGRRAMSRAPFALVAVGLLAAGCGTGTVDRSSSGDSFDPSTYRYHGVEALVLPIAAPWLKELEAAGFAERLAPRRVVPVHDGYLKDFFRTRRYDTYRQYLEQRKIGFEGGVGPEASLEL